MSGPDDYDYEERDELNLSSGLECIESSWDEELGAGQSNPQYDAAIGLRDNLQKTNDYGSKAKPNLAAKNFQSKMGGLVADGIVGPKTNTRAKQLGVTLPAPRKIASTPANTTANKDAATGLKAYLTKTNSFGSKAKPDATVKSYQTKMGGLVNDGIVGPKTRARAQALGAVLPQPKAAAPKPVAKPVEKPKVVVINKPETPPTPYQGAMGLKSYLERTGDFGTKAKPSATVATYQKIMDGLTTDGIVGPKTEARALHLGAKLPPRPSTVKPKTAVSSKQQQQNAAAGLRDYLKKTGSYDNDKNVLVYQKAMGGLDLTGATGTIGPKTISRAKELGVVLPPKPAAKKTQVTIQQAKIEPKKEATKEAAKKEVSKAVAKGNGPQLAAEMLKAYLIKTNSFGTKAGPDSTVAKAQKAMGNLVNDGIVGPKTTARAKALGVSLPVRPKNVSPAPQPGPTPEPEPGPTPYTEPEPSPGPVVNETSNEAKVKLAIIKRVSEQYPNLKLWNTLEFRKFVVDRLRAIGGEV